MDELRRIDLNLLLTLHALLSEKHVSRAALRLHKSQPAVSHSLALLRQHFDDPLLIRQGGKLQLSARAQTLLRPLDNALASLNTLLAQPDFDPAQEQRRFRLALSDYAARLLLPQLLRHVRQHAPGIDLIISQASRDAMMAQLMDGELDLALGLFPGAPQTLQVQNLFTERFTSIADKAVLPVRGLDDWLARPHVMVALRPDAHDEIESALDAIGRQRRIAVVLPHWAAAVELLAGTDLILTIATRAIGPMQRHPKLKKFRPPLELPEFSYQQAWHQRRTGDAAHRWLRASIAALVDQP